MVAALGVAVQRVGVILPQLIVESAAAEERAALFVGVFPLHLPEQEDAELRPEMETAEVIVAQPGSVALQPVEQQNARELPLTMRAISRSKLSNGVTSGENGFPPDIPRAVTAMPSGLPADSRRMAVSSPSVASTP